MLPYKVTRMRGENAVEASPEKIGSTADERWAVGRYQKCHIGNHRYNIVQCWTLKRRDETGKAVTVDIQRGREEAETWVKTGSY